MRKMFDPILLPEKLRQAREFRNYSQQGLADALKVHVTSYNKWEIGKNQPNAVVLAQIANEVRLKLDYFFTDMSPKDADLDYQDERSELERLSYAVYEMRSALSVAENHGDDPILQAAETNPTIRKLIERTRHLDEMRLQRIYDKIDGYLDGLDEAESVKSQKGETRAS